MAKPTHRPLTYHLQITSNKVALTATFNSEPEAWWAFGLQFETMAVAQGLISRCKLTTSSGAILANEVYQPPAPKAMPNGALTRLPPKGPITQFRAYDSADSLGL